MLRYCIVLFLAATTLLVHAEQEGDYARETRNLPDAELTPDRIPGLLLYVRSDEGVTADEAGVVQSWADLSGNGNDLQADLRGEHPARLTPNAIGGKPAVTTTHERHKTPGLQSEKLGIAPERGMTILVLARVNEPVHIGYLAGYGPTYKTAGSLAMYVHGTVSYGRSLLYASTGAETPSLEANGGNVVGKGFMLFAVRFDPATGEQSLYQNGVQVGSIERLEPLTEEHAFAVGMGVGGQWSLDGDILAVLAYNNALSMRDMRGIQRTLEAHYGLGGKPVSALAPLLPFAYYPSRNQMEVAIELSPEHIAKAGGTPPEQVGVRILNAETGEQVGSGSVPLDGQGRGQDIFDVPDLPNGTYAVEYVIGKHVERSPRTFERIHFPFEEKAYGATHKVYPPFTPVEVAGNDVAVVGRRYTVNAQGLLDSVVSLDRELLAEPMTLMAQTPDGETVAWKTGFLNDGVKGEVTHPDRAEFTCKSSSEVADLRATVVVEEDGCAQVALTLEPAAEPATIERLWIDIPLRDAEAPLFHYLGDNGMRFNYAGNTPRGGTIEWYREPWDGWVPQRWRVAEPGPDDGVIWTSADTRQHGNQHRWDHRPFCSQVWLGSEYRGLALLMENERNFATDYRTPLQQVIRDGERIVIRLEIFQRPVKLDAPRTFSFGFMASPGKPMEPEFRTRPFASGVGPVSCWGGWQCASKYPTERDWTIVERIQEIRRRGEYTDEDQQWFEAKYEEVKKVWPERKINNSTDWLWLTTHFARRAAERGRSHSGIYFEEHATDPRLPEFQVFQDEWASAEFNRFQKRSANWGVFSPSYHDFVLYMANEWMSRGVSLYFDNTNPKRCYNYRFGPAYRSPDGALRYGISIFGQRAYYRRIYKLLSEWNERGAEYPIDFTLHITNTQTLPFNTWATATLDLEQRSHTLNPEKSPPETEFTIEELSEGQLDKMTERARQRYEGKRKKLKNAGFQLPWPPDYTRTVSFGRQVGVIPTTLDFVSGHGRHQANDYSKAMLLRNWAMERIHDIRTGGMWMSTAALANDYNAVMNDFGYGDLDSIEHHNYWAEEPFAAVSDPRVKWQALRRRDGAEPFGLLLLQSYARVDAPTPTVRFPGAAALLDIETRELLRTHDGEALVAMPRNFATRMFLVAADPAVLAALAETGPFTEDFALATPVGWSLRQRQIEGRSYVNVAPEFLPREGDPQRRFWRIPPGLRDAGLHYRDDREILGEDYTVALRFRLGPVPDAERARLQHHDILQLQWRYVGADPRNDVEGHALRTSLRAAEVDGQLLWQLVRTEAVTGKEKAPLTVQGVAEQPDRIVLGPAEIGRWTTLSVDTAGNTAAVLLDGRLVATLDIPEVRGGTVHISHGSLLAGSRTEYLDLTDITIRPAEAP